MSFRNILLLVVALVVAAGTALFARGWMNAERAAMTQRQKPAPVAASQFVLVAKTNLPVGRFVKPEDFVWQGWPDGALAPSYLVKGKRQPEDLAGGVLRASLSAGEPMSDAKLVKPGERGFMAAVLRPGYRAASLSVNATSGIAGFVFPGDRVDLLVTHSVATEGGGARKTALATETALRDLRVLAVDQKLDDQDNKPQLAKTVTLEVTPKQAEMVRVVARLGSLSLSLRSLADEDSQPGQVQADPLPEDLVAMIEQGDAGLAQIAMPSAMTEQQMPYPAEGRFTTDREVSRLLGGLGGAAQKITVMRGAKREERAFRDGQPESPAAAEASIADPEMESAAAHTPEEALP